MYCICLAQVVNIAQMAQLSSLVGNTLYIHQLVKLVLNLVIMYIDGSDISTPHFSNTQIHATIDFIRNK